MKMKKIILYILMFLPLIITLIVLPFLSEQIPVHYDINNQVTRWGSRYETFIFPIITICFGIVMLLVAKLCSRFENGNTNEKITKITGIMCLFLFNVMTIYYLYTDFNKVEDLSTVAIDIYQITCGIIGISVIVMGKMMPQLKMNSWIGLRTAWSMKNEITWKKSQKFGGMTFMLAGLIIVMICCLTKGMNCLLWSLIALLAILPIDIYYTYRTAKIVEK